MAESSNPKPCPICKEDIDNGSEVSTIGQKGANGINAASTQRVLKIIMSESIPVIDLSRFGPLVEDEEDVDVEMSADIGKRLYDVLKTSGFAYLSNHGIPKQKIDGMNEIGAKFFALPQEEKRKLYQHDLSLAFDPLGATKVDAKHVDYQEGFRVTGEAFGRNNLAWPNITKFRETCFDFAEICKRLQWRILKALGVGMKLKDPDYFYKAHSLMNHKGNCTMLKMIQFPPILGDDVLCATGLRLGEHTDWMALTFLFQDSIGGLQRKSENGEFCDVTPIPGTIVLNIGDVLQKWSNGRLKATVHRVLPPKDAEKRKKVRRSIVYFGSPNIDVLIEPLKFEDGTEDATKPDENPMTVEQYMAKRSKDVFY